MTPSMDLTSVSSGLINKRSASSGDIPGKTTRTLTKGTGMSGSASRGRRSSASNPPMTAKIMMPIVIRQLRMAKPTIPTMPPMATLPPRYSWLLWVRPLCQQTQSLGPVRLCVCCQEGLLPICHYCLRQSDL